MRLPGLAGLHGPPDAAPQRDPIMIASNPRYWADRPRLSMTGSASRFAASLLEILELDLREVVADQPAFPPLAGLPPAGTAGESIFI